MCGARNTAYASVMSDAWSASAFCSSGDLSLRAGRWGRHQQFVFLLQSLQIEAKFAIGFQQREAVDHGFGGE